jgi:hypothetical protein
MAININWFNPNSTDSLTNDYENGRYTGGIVYGKTKMYQYTNLNGIFGVPYQFLPTVDRRLQSESAETDNDYIGRKYAEKVAARLPLLFLTPCRQKFMEDFATGEDKTTILNQLVTGVNTSNLGSTGKYYSTEFAYAQYYRMINKIATEVCYFMGLQNQRISFNGNTYNLIDMDWRKLKNDEFNNFYAAHNSVVYFVDGLTTMTDSFSNSTTDSSLASSINGYSDQAREIKFLLGPNSALTQMYENMGDATSGIADSLSSITSNLTGGMISDLASTGIDTIVSGGKIIFPKIWNNSEFNRSYSFDIKLRSPDHDSLSIFLNIILPYLHLLGFVLPQSLDSNDPNGYQTPFLLKAYCKGLFNIDMGIITDMSVTRGAECQWNDDGLPTQIDISITIEDLYNSLMITQEQRDNNFGLQNLVPFDIVTNTSMVDYLANLSGLNIAATEVTRKAALLYYLTGSSVKRIPSDIYNRADNFAHNLIRRVYNKLTF